VQDVLDEIELETSHHDKVARTVRLAYVATVTRHDAEGRNRSVARRIP
jgi:hypothetical protein